MTNKIETKVIHVREQIEDAKAKGLLSATRCAQLRDELSAQMVSFYASHCKPAPLVFRHRRLAGLSR